MDAAIGTFFGYSLSVGGLVAGITQIVKLLEEIPFLSRIPFVQWLLDAIAKENPTAVRVFVVFLCVVGNIVSQWLATGHPPVLNLVTLEGTVMSFMAATASFHLVLQPFEKK